MPNNNWASNLTDIESGVFRSINGNSDEMIGASIQLMNVILFLLLTGEMATVT